MEFIGHTTYCLYNGEYLPREVAVKDVMSNRDILYLVDLSDYRFKEKDVRSNRWCEFNLHGLPIYPGYGESSTLPLHMVAHAVRTFVSGASIAVKGLDQAQAFLKMGCRTHNLEELSPIPPFVELLNSFIPPPTHGNIHRHGFDNRCSMSLVYCMEQFLAQKPKEEPKEEPKDTSPPPLYITYRGKKWVYIPYLDCS